MLKTFTLISTARVDMETALPKKVLLIDDNEIDLVIAKKVIAFSQTGRLIIHTIDTVSGALSYLAGLEEGEKPDLIFLDLYLPYQDGRDFLRVLGEQPGLISAKTRIYILSSSIHARDFAEFGQNPYVTGCFSKPFTSQFMAAAIENRTSAA
jgi:two-component system, chemotaxis family, chemotaxis protein CheY